MGRPLAAARGADVVVVSAEQAEDLDGMVACGSEPVRKAGVELGALAGAKGGVVVGQDQAHLSGEHVEQ